MVPELMKNTKLQSLLLFSLALILFSSCAYYNTFYNALKAYDTGITKKETKKDGPLTEDVKREFQASIDKSWKLINLYSDSSSWADDALLLIGKSHYQIEEYEKTERFLQQFLIRYNSSELMPEARLWLSRAYLKLEKTDKAEKQLNEILSREGTDEISAEAYFSLGELLYTRNNYDPAIANLLKAVELSEDEQRIAEALFTIGTIYFEQKDFQKSIDYFNRVREYEGLIETEFQSQMKKVDAQIELQEYDLALKTLQTILRESRFIDKYSIIEARIGDIYAMKGDSDYSINQYAFVLEKYPRTQGSASAAFGLAVLMENYIANVDSARKLYSRVPTEFAGSDHREEAIRRTNLLKNYQTIKKELLKDEADYLRLTHPDSISKANEISIEDSLQAIADSLLASSDSLAADSAKLPPASAPKPAGPAQRTVEQVIKSIEKNRFKLAEYFLLNMQNYDSAAAYYNKFIEGSSDSVLVPKAYHALNYLYLYKISDPVRTDSIETLILTKYPGTPFSDFIRKKRGEKIVAKKAAVDSVKLSFLNAENLYFSEDYNQALTLFTRIAEKDSGTSWAEKSRFRIAWYYEKVARDTEKALEAYSVLAKEYPVTPSGKFAAKRIAEPPKEVPPVDSTALAADSLANQFPLPDSTGVQEESRPPKQRPGFDDDVFRMMNSDTSAVREEN
jgi:TolA-binding protein